MTQVEITFLGTTAGVPTKYRNHASIYLRYQSENEFFYLFDCGEGTQRQIFSAGLNFMRISDIFISHWHADHFAGLLGLMQTMNLEHREKPLNIFGPEATKFVNILRSLGYSRLNYHVHTHDVDFESKEISTLLEENEFIVQSIPAKHSIPAAAFAFVEKDRVKIDKDKITKLGLPPRGKIYKDAKEKGHLTFRGREILLEEISTVEKGKKVVYSGDTLPTKNMIKLAEGADLLIHDSTFFSEDFSEDEGYKHANFADVLKIAEEANVKEVILTHISRRYQDTSELKEKIADRKNVRIAKDFMKVVL